MIQIHNVTDDVYRQLKSRAASLGVSLSDYLLKEIRQIASRPTMREMRERLHRRASVCPTISPAEIIRAERDRS